MFKRKGGEIFGDHNLPSGDQKFILDRQLASVLKSLIQTLNTIIVFGIGWWVHWEIRVSCSNIQQVTLFDNPNQI